MDIRQPLLSILPAERVKTRLIELQSYASDAGFYQLVPKAVVQPVFVEEIKALMLFSKNHRIPLVFRTGGTSLSGQSITDGLLVDLSRHWKGIQVGDGGKSVTVQPGITGAMVNQFLKKYHSKIGPDPSSINAAMMGGIISNNSSGMCCGVAYNSYHTLQSMRFVLVNGHEYNTALATDYNRFVNDEKQLAERLIQLRKQITGNDLLRNRIREKYQTKNTVGYGLNSFLDYGHPLDIFSHLLVGAEGTLAFIAEATLQTLPDKPFKAAAMLYFADIYSACDAILPLTASGAEALELMDRASLRSVETLKGLPSFFQSLPDGSAAILCEYQTETQQELTDKLQQLSPVLQSLPLLHAAEFATDEYTRSFYWKIRKGMFPSVGAVRAAGTTVILEDVAFPVAQLGNAVSNLQLLFKQYQYDNAIVFGHAKDGNIHFVITQLLDSEPEIKRYDLFLRAVVDLVVNKYDGTLKAEHGTGRNMAPFVEAEWGGEALQIMREIKAAADPLNLLNPGVIINDSKTAHLDNLKDLPSVEAEVDKCIECGYCEHVCPSRDVTMTPRRRIVVRRVLQRMKMKGDTTAYAELLRQYQYDGLDTCATDGLCASECPVDINTGDLVKRLRNEQHGGSASKMANWVANHFKRVERLAGAGVGILSAVDRIFNWHIVHHSSRMLHRIFRVIPVWMKETGKPPQSISSVPLHPELVYFSACINRVMSSHAEGKPSLQQTFLNLCKKAGVEVLLPPDIAGYCCGQPFSSKGFNAAARKMETKTIDALLIWSDNGRLPIVCDFTSCTYTFLHNQTYLSEADKIKFARLTIIDSVSFLQQTIVPKITIHRKKETVAVHPTCAVTKLHLNGEFSAIAQACANEVVLPKYAGCCGMAGDRGFQVPELVDAATKLEMEELAKHSCNGHYSSATTCELALTKTLGKRYEHIAYLLDEASVPNT
jgi:D-lactate dehydrogenase